MTGDGMILLISISYLATQFVEAGDGANDRAFLNQSYLPREQSVRACRSVIHQQAELRRFQVPHAEPIVSATPQLILVQLLINTRCTTTKYPKHMYNVRVS